MSDGGSLAVNSDNLKITTSDTALRSIINVKSDGFFSLKAGTLTSGNTNISRAIVCVDNGGSMEMSGGTVQGSEGYESRGVYLQSTDMQDMSFTMTGGVIKNCYLAESGTGFRHGGGVYVTGLAEFTMSGTALITGCSAEFGGGVYVHNQTENQTGMPAFYMNGGTISNCTAWNGGGGIFTEKNNTFKMTGGSVTNNTAHDGGGGLFIRTLEGAEISCGYITGNKSECNASFGGGIYVEKEATLQLYNAVIKDNTAAALGGGLWTCSTGDIKVYVTDGGAVYDNRAQATDVTRDSNQAGDDISNFMGSGHLTLYNYMLGGGLNQYYKDGGVTLYLGTPDCDADRGWGTGAPSKSAKRYGPDFQELYTDTVEKSTSIALKNIVTKEAKTGAENKAKVVISGNSASRGGGIGTNGNLIIGTPQEKTYTVNIEKVWSDNTPVDKKGEVSAYLVIGTQTMGHVKLNSSNGWKATFTGLIEDPDEVVYSVQEVSVDGFTTAISDAKIDGNTISFTITNTYNPTDLLEPENGSLTVSKTVEGNNGDTQKEFHFTVTLSDANINGKYGDMEFTNGVAYFTLKHGESKNAENLPVNTTYTVVEQEANQDGYTTTFTGANGTITEDGAETSFVNTKNGDTPPDPDPQTGDLMVSKTVSGNRGDTSKGFRFTVPLGDTSIDGKYGDMTFHDGVAEFTLKHGQSMKATGLPAGIRYTVTESDNAGYTVTSTGETGSIVAGDTAVVVFNNHKSGGSESDTVNVTVKKVWKLDDGGKATDSVTVVLLRDGEEYRRVELNDENGWTYTWTGLSDTFTWIVAEVNVPDGFTAKVDQDGMIFTITNDDNPSESDEPTDPDKPAVPDKPTDDIPKTGDETNLALWMVLLGISGIGVITTLLSSKRRYKGKHSKR